MKADDRDCFLGEIRDAQYAIHSARVYAKEGNVVAAMDCIRIAGERRRIAKGFLTGCKAMP